MMKKLKKTIMNKKLKKNRSNVDAKFHLIEVDDENGIEEPKFSLKLKMQTQVKRNKMMIMNQPMKLMQLNLKKGLKNQSSAY